MSSPGGAYLVRGNDPALVAQATDALVARLVGDSDPALVVDHIDSSLADAAAIDAACRTVPFLAPQRVVLLREAGMLNSECVDALIAYLADPLETTSLVVASGGGATSPRLLAAMRKSAEMIDADPPTGRARDDWLHQRLSKAPVRIEAKAAQQLAKHLGNDLGRLDQILAALGATYGQGAHLGSDELAPYLGEAGDTAPWELTDAIDSGEEGSALYCLRRLCGSGGRHPLVILSTLHRHFATAMRLDGAGTTTDAEAAALIGGSPFAARKANALAKRLGWDGLSRATCLLADADTDLRGTTGAGAEVVLDVLVARLARMCRASRRSGQAAPSSPRRRPRS